MPIFGFHWIGVIMHIQFRWPFVHSIRHRNVKATVRDLHTSNNYSESQVRFCDTHSNPIRQTDLIKFCGAHLYCRIWFLIGRSVKMPSLTRIRRSIVSPLYGSVFIFEFLPRDRIYWVTSLCKTGCVSKKCLITRSLKICELVCWTYARQTFPNLTMSNARLSNFWQNESVRRIPNILCNNSTWSSWK